jgi:glycosyltransferase involved in cell wall biosynthesis
MTANLARIVQRVRAASIPIIFDVDDLIFEPESIDYVDALKSFSAAQKAEYAGGVHQYRAALLACDAATCPTEFLRERIERLGKKVRVVPNTINAAQLARAGRTAPKPSGPSEMLRIGYFSGSYTHNCDFLEAATAIEEVLAENANVAFHIVGDLDLPDSFNRFADRIHRSPFLPYLQMLDLLGRMDVNIAPLEMDNPYTAGKSELKIFEAALVGVPTVASAVDSYLRTIDDGQNGFLARTPEEWKKHLTALVRDASLRQRVGEAARRDFVPRFRADQVVDRMIAAYEELRRQRPAATALDPSCLDIAWIVPPPFAGSGGHRNIYRAISNLARYGHRLTVYHTDWDPRQDARAFVSEHFFDLPDVHFASLEGGVGPHEVCFATHWSTVAPLMRSRDVIRYPFYFVQDFEPLFYPMSSEYLLAEQTYRMGLTHITSGPWPAALLRKRYGADADHFLFPVQRSVYYPAPRTKKQRNILFFARPEMPRRCYDLGLEMLKQVKNQEPSVEIILFGSHAINTGSIPFPHNNLHLLPGLKHLATLYRNADLGIVFSTTNPSLVPYEMMACGLAVCDLALEDADLNYGCEDNVFLLPPDPASMAREVVRILQDDDERQRRARNGCAFVQSFPDEDGCGRRIEELILRKVLGGELNPPVPSSPPLAA